MGRRRNSLRRITRGRKAKASSGKSPAQMSDMSSISTLSNSDCMVPSLVVSSARCDFSHTLIRTPVKHTAAQYRRTSVSCRLSARIDRLKIHLASFPVPPDCTRSCSRSLTYVHVYIYYTTVHVSLWQPFDVPRVICAHIAPVTMATF